MASLKRLRFRKVSRAGIPVAELLQAHDQFSDSLSLADNIGDGLLCALNPVYRLIREETLDRGGKFVQSDPFHYFSFPLMALDDLVDQKTFPYHNNVYWLEALESRAPGRFTLSELKRSELKFNYLFHECAHFLAHERLFPGRKMREVEPSSDSLLRILLGESFANSVECLSGLFSKGPIEGFFLEANCHFRLQAHEVEIMRRAGEKIGYSKLFRAVLCSFLYGNFLYQSLGVRERKRLLELVGLREFSPISTVSRVGFTLCRKFRTNTTPLHLLKLGFPDDLLPLASEDPLEQILRNASLRQEFTSLADSVGQRLSDTGR